MKKRFGLMALLLGASLFGAACGSNTTETAATGTDTPAATQEMTIKHQLGEVTIEKNPKKVVVYDFGALDTLDKLGVEVVGLPQSNLPKYLSKYKDSKYKNVGTVKEPDFEALSALDPDLILISGRLQTFYKDLSEVAPTVFVGVDNAKYMESFKQNTEMLGDLFGKEKEVDAEIAKIEAEVKQIQDKASKSDKKALTILSNEGAISAYGPGSRFGIIHDVMKVPAVDDKIEVSTHGQSISFEYIAEKNPDYLFVFDRGTVVTSTTAAPAAKDLIENALVKKTKASQENNIVYLNPDFWYLSGGGLVSVSEMVKEVSSYLK